MKLLRFILEGLPNFSEALDVNFVARQRVGEDDKEKLYHVFSSIYVNQAIAFVGINASGKTTILKAVSFAMRVLNNESVNTIEAREILRDINDDVPVKMMAYFYQDGVLYKLETLIGKQKNSVDGSERFIILDECLWSKEASRVKTKKSLFEFGNDDKKERRDQKEQYLMDDVSIIVALNKKNGRGFFVRDMLKWTDHNLLNVLGRFPKELLTFLDPSIEHLECDLSEKKVDMRLKFFGRDEIVINNMGELGNYLSSGTIKGLGVFMSAVFAFAEGGYLIMDELENHFNREIVATLIRFFMDEKVNPNGATLLFSTHYSELLDEFDRNDGIYIVRNREGIEAQNLSSILTRNDIKKSEAYDSDYLGGTVPVYEAYMALKKVLIGINDRGTLTWENI